MPWIVLFFASWLLFALLADRRRLGMLWYTGLAAVALQLLVDTAGIGGGLYRVADPVVALYGSSLFFTLGPALAMGTLFGMHLPRSGPARIVNVLVWTGLFCSAECLLVDAGALVYRHWSKLGSAAVNLVTFTVLSALAALREARFRAAS
ncbi:MAG: hypothetical protein H5T97_11765 [Firmicutes bacterium]|nr:hypothetical protein [Bacillota bacterium]